MSPTAPTGQPASYCDNPPAALNHQRSKPGDTWHLDEVQLKNREKAALAVARRAREGIVLDILVQTRQSRKAERFLRRVMAGWWMPMAPVCTPWHRP